MTKRAARTRFTAYVTKHALTYGIVRIEAEDRFDISPDMIGDAGRKWGSFHGEGKEWHRTPESALARAEKMRASKIASLKAQIGRLQKRQFKLSKG